MSPQCREELAAFRQDSAENINKNIPLARACRDDVKEHCSKKKYDRDNAADILACLRRIKRTKVGGGAGGWRGWVAGRMVAGMRAHAGLARHAGRDCRVSGLLGSMHGVAGHADMAAPPLPASLPPCLLSQPLPACSCRGAALGRCSARRWRRQRALRSTCTCGRPAARMQVGRRLCCGCFVFAHN